MFLLHISENSRVVRIHIFRFLREIFRGRVERSPGSEAIHSGAWRVRILLGGYAGGVRADSGGCQSGGCKSGGCQGGGRLQQQAVVHAPPQHQLDLFLLRTLSAWTGAPPDL